MSAQKKYYLFLGLILLIGLFFRFYQINQIPPGLYPDEAINANDAWSAWQNKNFAWFYPENNGREGLFINLIALSMGIFGHHFWAVKIVSALIGWLTLLGFYFLVKAFWKILGYQGVYVKHFALLATFFLATSFWAINFSRIAFRAVLVPFCLVWAAFFILRGFNKQQNSQFSWDFALAGIFLGLGFHSYIAFRIAPLVFLPIFLVSLWQWIKLKEKRKSIFLNWLVLLFFFIVLLSPLALYFIHHPSELINRTSQISIFSANSPIKEFLIVTGKTILMFNFHGDDNWRHNFSGKPELFWPIGVLFVVGLLANLRQVWLAIKKHNWDQFWLFFFWPFWFLIMLMPELLTREGIPHSLRAIGVLPVVYFWVTWGIVFLFNYLNRCLNRQLILGLGGIFLVIVLSHQFWYYFIAWGKNPNVAGAFRYDLALKGKQISQVPLNKKVKIIVPNDGKPVPYPNGPSISAQSIKFFAYPQKPIFLKPK